MTTKVTIPVVSSTITSNLFPTGGLMMWPSNSAPSGFLLCDGSTVSRTTYSALFAIVGTTFGAGDGSTTFALPNYINRFPVGAGSSYNVGSAGGSADNTLVSHSHTGSVSGTTSAASNDHTHTYSGSTGGQSANHSHGISDPGHNHLFGGDDMIEGAGYVRQSNWSYDAISSYAGGGGNYYTKRLDNTNNPQSTGITGTGGVSNDHSHAFSGTTSGFSANHTHTWSGSFTTSTEGSSGTNANLPPYLGIRFIIKT